MQRREFIQLVGSAALGFPSFVAAQPNAKPRRLYADHLTEGNWPNATTTGVPAGTTLTVYDGDLKTTSNGQVIDALDVRGRIIVLHPDVVIKRCKAWHIIADYNANGGSPTRMMVQDCEIDGQDSSGGINCISIVGTDAKSNLSNPSPADGAQILRCNIWNAENGLWIEAHHCTVQDCYIHDLSHSTVPDPHIDGAQCASPAAPNLGGTGRLSYTTFRHCNFDGGVSSQITSNDTDYMLVDNCRLRHGANLITFDGTYNNCTVQYCDFIPEPMGNGKYWNVISANGTGTITRIGNYYGT